LIIAIAPGAIIGFGIKLVIQATTASATSTALYFVLLLDHLTYLN
jgi:hypothetical protein